MRAVNELTAGDAQLQLPGGRFNVENEMILP